MELRAEDSARTPTALIAVAAVAALGLALLLASLAPQTAQADHCGAPPGGFKHVKTKHMGCETGLEVARLSFNDTCIDGGCTVMGFSCNARHGHMKCVKGRKKVTYDFVK